MIKNHKGFTVLEALTTLLIIGVTFSFILASSYELKKNRENKIYINEVCHLYFIINEIFEVNYANFIEEVNKLYNYKDGWITMKSPYNNKEIMIECKYTVTSLDNNGVKGIKYEIEMKPRYKFYSRIKALSDGGVYYNCVEVCE